MALRDHSSKDVSEFGTFLRQRGLLVEGGGRAPSRVNDPEGLWRAGAALAGDLADAVADFHKLPRTNLAAVAARKPLLRDLSRRYLRETFVYPYDEDGTPTLAVADPARGDVIRAMRLAFGRPVALKILSFEEIEL